MKFHRAIILVVSFIHLYSCADYKTGRTDQDKEKVYYSSSGFALIFEDRLYEEKIISKKINNDEIRVMHNFLKKNTLIKIINPLNSKTVETKIYNNSKYPKIFNIVISQKIASILELDINNPYIEIIEVKKNKTFIAKEGNIFDEEKNVAEKAPISEVKMDDLTKEKIKNQEISTKDSNYILVISDFYYLDSANNLKKELSKKMNINNISVKKINNKYRLLVGPFKNFNALKNTYISLNNLGFEEINIYKE